MSQVRMLAEQAKRASETLGILREEQKNAALEKMAQALLSHTQEILAANAQDLEAARQKGTSQAMLDRLALTPERIAGMAEGIRKVIALPDPVGEVLEEWTAQSGITIEKRSVPFGVVGIIYEARPNVTSDAAALCIKTGNAALLKGGSDALGSNLAIAGALKEALAAAGLPGEAIGMIADPSREAANEMMRMNDLVDVLIPRGGAGLIATVVKNATVPVIETGVGNCHVYVDESADLQMAERIVVNAKTSRPSVCNAIENLLVHESIADAFLQFYKDLTGTQLRVSFRYSEEPAAQHIHFLICFCQFSYTHATPKLYGTGKQFPLMLHITFGGTEHFCQQIITLR